MDFFNHLPLYRLISRFCGRIQKIPKNAQRRLWASKLFVVERYRRRTLGALFLLTSLVLGFYADKKVQDEAGIKWGRQHPPSLMIVSHALEKYGWRALRDDEIHLAQKVMRLMPTHLDESASFWLNQDRNWLVYFEDQDSTIHPRVYCQVCNRFPVAQPWQPLGSGWLAFEEVIRLIQDLKPSLALQKSVQKKPRRSVDPREMIY